MIFNIQISTIFLTFNLFFSFVLAEFSYVGCYSNGSLSGVPVFNQYQSTSFCKNQCGSYQYAAISNASYCVCSNSAPGNSKVSDSNCDSPCSGYPYETCGGVSYYSIWANEDLVSNLTSSSSTTSSSLTTQSSPSKITTSATVKSSKTSTNGQTITSLTIVTTKGGVETTLTEAITPTSTSSSSNENTNKSTTTHRGISGGAIAGIVVGVVAGVTLFVGALFYFWRRSQKNNDFVKNSEIETTQYRNRNSLHNYQSNMPTPPIGSTGDGDDDYVDNNIQRLSIGHLNPDNGLIVNNPNRNSHLQIVNPDI